MVNIRLTDHLAFWAIKHLFSRPSNHVFDPADFERFSSEWRHQPVERFYALQDADPCMEHMEKELRGLTKSGRHIVRLPTPAPCGVEANNSMWIEFHLGRPLGEAPIFFVQHGWRSVSVRGYHSMCRGLNEQGVNAGVLHLPYHFSRKPRGAFNGELAITSDIVRSAYALRQAVQEVCVLKRVLKRLGAPHVGLWGTSYGAWVSAMAVTMEEGFDGALLLEPPVEIEELFWETPLFSNLQKELNRLKIPRREVSDFFNWVTPYRHAPKIPPARVLILGSEHDPIGHPASLRKLNEAWKGSYLEIFPFGHISYRLHTSAVDRFLKILAPQLKTF